MWLLLVLVSASCAQDGTQPLTADQVAKVEVGMLMREVQAELGRPRRRLGEHWTYEPREGPYERIEITFEHDKVDTIHTSDRR